MPKKSNVSAHSSGDGEDAGPVTNGFGVEVPSSPISALDIPALTLAKRIGSPAAEIHDHTTSQGRAATQHVDTERCDRGHQQECDCVCQLLDFDVRPRSRPEHKYAVRVCVDVWTDA